MSASRGSGTGLATDADIHFGRAVRDGPGSRLVAVGTALPAGRLTNDDLAEMMDTDDAWIRSRTGIGERRVGGTTTGLAVEAAREALDRSGVDPATVDLVIVATQTPDDLCPSTASGVQHALGLRCGALDVNAACAGFSYGVTLAHGMLKTGARSIIVAGVDRMAAATNYSDRSTAILFGDGAGAVVMTRAESADRGVQAWDTGADGSRPEILMSPIIDGRITGVTMDGKAVFRTIVRHVVASAKTAVGRAGLELDDIVAVLAHQANQRILDTVADRLGMEREKFVSVIEHTGNTSAASVPLALDHAVREGRVRTDDAVLLMGFGGGLAWASTVAVWG